MSQLAQYMNLEIQARVEAKFSGSDELRLTKMSIPLPGWKLWKKQFYLSEMQQFIIACITSMLF